MGVIPGRLRRFNEGEVSEKAPGGRNKKSVPCIGWNSAAGVGSETGSGSRRFCWLADSEKYYYAHSYYVPYHHDCELERNGWSVASVVYGLETYVGAIGKDNVFATQFHPEKSGKAGLRVIQAFLDGKMWQESPSADAAHYTNGVVRSETKTLRSSADEIATNGLARRIIACLDVRTNDEGDLVVTKGDQYDVRENEDSASYGGSDDVKTTRKTVAGQVRNLGKPVHLAEKYYLQSADEITFLNITSFRNTPVADLPMLEILRQTSRTVFVPLTVGGGIRDTVDPVTGRQISALQVAKLYFASGADKISIGSDAVLAAEEYYRNNCQATGKTALETISAAYGCQAVVVSVDPKRVYVDPPSSPSTRVISTAYPDPETGREHVWYQCTISGGREFRDLDVRQLVIAAQALGAGEILLNAIDRDGTNRGFDKELIRHVKEAVSIPVIASSGAGEPAHFQDVFQNTTVDAALGAGIFHRGEYTVREVKEWVEREAGMSVR